MNALEEEARRKKYFRRVRLTKDSHFVGGKLKAPAGATGYVTATGLLFGFSAVLFDTDCAGVAFNGDGRPHQEVLALYLEDA